MIGTLMVHGNQSAHELLGFAPGEMPLETIAALHETTVELVREFNGADKDKKPDADGRRWEKHGNLWVASE